MNRSLPWLGGLALGAILLWLLLVFPVRRPAPEVRQVLLQKGQVSRLIASPKSNPGGRRSFNPRWISFEADRKLAIYVTTFDARAKGAERMLLMSEKLRTGTPPTETVAKSVDRLKGAIQLPLRATRESYLCLLQSDTECAVIVRISYGARPE